MYLRIAIATIGSLLLLAGGAGASEFDGWTLRQIRRHADFTRDTTSMSSAFNTARKGGRRVYHWIGYIPSGAKRVYFTSFGEPLTAVKWEKTGEWVPEWVVDALDRLEEEGYIKLNVPGPETSGEVAVVGGNG